MEIIIINNNSNKSSMEMRVAIEMEARSQTVYCDEGWTIEKTAMKTLACLLSAIRV